MHRGFQCEYGFHNAVRITVYIDSPVGCTSGRTIVGCTRTLDWDWQHFIEIAGDFCGKRIAMDVRSYRSSSCWSRDPSAQRISLLAGQLSINLQGLEISGDFCGINKCDRARQENVGPATPPACPLLG